MLFNSLEYAIFLPVVFILYWLLPHKLRWIILLAASYFFYMSWNPRYIVLILATTVVSYGAARIIERTTSRKRKKAELILSLLILGGGLLLFKYFNYFNMTFVSLLNKFSFGLQPVILDIIIPVGISFYTFQAISYVVDVYVGKSQAEKNFGIYATFVSFFPQLVAGPIERTENLLPQIKKQKEFDYESATYGLKLMAWGFFKKLVIADNLAVIVDNVYNNLQGYVGFSLIAATIFFAFQIYCDFSGYSDIALGTAKLFGIKLTRNFSSPYFSESFKEYWGRWHISLSQWFRDYVYIPLGGNRCSKLRNSINLFITFAVSGLWHGANTTFVIWGCLHGLLQIIERIIIGKKRSESALYRFFSIIFVFLMCSFAWIFFRASDMQCAVYVINHMFEGCADVSCYFSNAWVMLSIPVPKLLVLVFAMVLLLLFDYMSLKGDVILRISRCNVALRWIIYVVFVLFIVFFRAVNQNPAFIYFQF